MTTVQPGTSVESDDWSSGRLTAAYEAMRLADRRDGPPSITLRRDRLDRLALAVLSHADELCAAVDADFGGRPQAATRVGEIATSVQSIAGARRSLRQWAKVRRPRPTYMALAGVRGWVEPHPLGVVGVMSPWNFPIVLAMQPIAAALAAGNRVLLKPSEVTARTSSVLAKAIGEHFADDEIAVVIGGVQTGIAFSKLPFDHLLFTGASSVGKQVAAAAAENLVPVTLELGGKNPAVVDTRADLRAAARRLAAARLANAGQICLSPDYVMVPRAMQDDFVRQLLEEFRKLVPDPVNDPDYCAIVNERHFERINSLLRAAQAAGAIVRPVSDEASVRRAAARCRIVPTVVTGVTDAMALSHEEVFGPVLTVVPYDQLDDVIDHVNARPSPLAAYWFGPASVDYTTFKARTRSGAVTRNDFALHAALDGLPFGGVGNSGTGYYHGKFGFDTFSHLRAVASSPRLFSPMSILSPPYSARLDRGVTTALDRYTGWVARRVARADRTRGA